MLFYLFQWHCERSVQFLTGSHNKNNVLSGQGRTDIVTKMTLIKFDYKILAKLPIECTCRLWRTNKMA